MSANLSSCVGGVSLVQFWCCIRKNGVVLSQIHFCRLCHMLGTFWLSFITVLTGLNVISTGIVCCIMLVQCLYMFISLLNFKNVFYRNSRFSVKNIFKVQHRKINIYKH